VQLDPYCLAKDIAARIKFLPAKFGFEAIRDIQMLCPMNRGSLGIRELNVKLQGELNEVALAYAITIHKSQGSEFPAVVTSLATQQ